MNTCPKGVARPGLSPLFRIRSNVDAAIDRATSMLERFEQWKSMSIDGSVKSFSTQMQLYVASEQQLSRQASMEKENRVQSSPCKTIRSQNMPRNFAGKGTELVRHFSLQHWPLQCWFIWPDWWDLTYLQRVLCRLCKHNLFGGITELVHFCFWVAGPQRHSVERPSSKYSNYSGSLLAPWCLKNGWPVTLYSTGFWVGFVYKSYFDYYNLHTAMEHGRDSSTFVLYKRWVLSKGACNVEDFDDDQKLIECMVWKGDKTVSQKNLG